MQPPREASNKGKQPEESHPRPSTQANPKGKQVERPVQAGLDSEQPQEAPPEQPENPAGKGKQPEVKSTPGPSPGAAIVANARVSGGFPQVYITRIPVSKDGKPRSMRRVVVYVIPDTAYRHPQTLFFKNIPNVAYYWGLLNDAAGTAQRIVRMEREGNPTPYFLYVNRGEYPKATSPRNDNAVFAGMDVPVFGDAFVFKLGNPETSEGGYARYAHVEKDLASIDWIPEAIQAAARKVDNARADSANAGFPDLDNYADPETMFKDAKRMSTYVKAIRRAAAKGSRALPVRAKAEIPKVETRVDTMKQRLVEQMTILLHGWEKDMFAYVQGDTEPTSDQNLGQASVQKAVAAFRDVEDSADGGPPPNLDKASSSSPVTHRILFELKTTQTVDKVHNVFRAMKTAFDNFYNKMQIAREAARGRSTSKLEIHNAINDVYIAFEAMLKEIDLVDFDMQKFFEGEVGKRIETEFANQGAPASKIGAASTSEAIPKMADLPGYPGTSNYRVERFD